MTKLIKKEWLREALSKQRELQKELARHHEELIWDLADSFLFRLQQMEQDLMDNLPSIVMECLRQLLGSLGQQVHQPLVEEAVRQALQYRRLHPRPGEGSGEAGWPITVYMGPPATKDTGETNSPLEQAFPQLPPELEGRVEFVAEQDLEPGDCIIQWGPLWGDYRLKTRLEALESWLSATRPDPAGDEACTTGCTEQGPTYKLKEPQADPHEDP